MQAASAEHYAAVSVSTSASHRSRSPAERGSIFDRNGNDLALSVAPLEHLRRPARDHEPGGDAAQLAPIVGVDAATLDRAPRQKDRAFVYVARKVEDDVATQVRALGLPGVGFVPESKRYYPASRSPRRCSASSASTTTGSPGSRPGTRRTLARHARARWRSSRTRRAATLPDGERRVRAPERGADLVLTLDQSLQYEVERVLTDEVTQAKAKGGMVVIADVRTGDVLAMATVDGATSDAPAHPAHGTCSTTVR